jgi:hypothetical protein
MFSNHIIHTYLKRSHILNAQIKHILQVATLVNVGLPSDLTLTSRIHNFFPDPFTVHTFTLHNLFAQDMSNSLLTTLLVQAEGLARTNRSLL